MANTDKNILITPNVGQEDEPRIDFTGADNNLVSLKVLDSGALSFEGSNGQLFSIVDDNSGTVFSVNDISGIPSIEVEDTGNIKLAEFGGNVGIGISDPTDPLHVSGNVRATGSYIVSGKGSIKGASHGMTIFSTGDTVFEAGGTTERVRLTSDGKLGIGTSSPATTLDVAGNASVRNVNTNNSMTFKADAGDGHILRYGGSGSGSDIMRFVGVGDVEKVRITSGGNVGIGTETPTEKLDVVGDVSLNSSQSTEYSSSLTSSSPTGSKVRIKNTSTTSETFSGLVLVSTNENNINGSLSLGGISKANRTELEFVLGQRTSNGYRERLRVDVDGNVGIGTDNPTAKLHVVGNFKSTELAEIQGIKIGNGGAVTNTIVGAATKQDITAPNNTVLGSSALQSLTTGFSNTAIGSESSRALTTGAGNVTIGRKALFQSTEGGNNVAVGNSSLQESNGNQNVAIGNNALQNGQNTSRNTAVGASSQISATGVENTSVGIDALKNATGGVNTVIGKLSGSQITSGSRNSILGSHSGNQHGIDFRETNNNVILSDGAGNVSFWKDSGDNVKLLTANTERLRISSDGNVGVGKTDPSERLDVAGTVLTEKVQVKVSNNVPLGNTTDLLTVESGSFASNQNRGITLLTNSDSTGNDGWKARFAIKSNEGGTPRVAIESPSNDQYGTLEAITIRNGNVGIGKPVPTARLHVNGSALITGDLTVNGTTTSVNSTVTTINDPVITIGDDSPSSSDSKDRGIEFKYGDGSDVKTGFFGMDRGDSRFKFIPDASNSSEDFSGSLGEIQASRFIGDVTGTASGNYSKTEADGRFVNVSGDTLTGDLSLPQVIFTGADGTDSARISATRSGSSTYFDFILSDDAGQEDSWRWQFSQSGAGTHTAMRLDPQSETSSNLTISGDLTVSGGDITLGGTGRIQGIDTVSASTDATNKAYVDAATESAKASTVQVITDNKTISSTDEYKVLYFKNTSDITVTLPDAETVPTGFNFKIANAGLAKVTFATSNGDVINNSKTTFDLFGGAELHKVSDDEYLIIE